MNTPYLKPQTVSPVTFTICLILSFLLLTGMKCKKENLNTMPPATTSGENTMGAYIDGKLFVSRRRDLLSTDPGATYNPAIPLLGFGGGSILNPDGPTFGFSLTENLNKGRLIFTPGGKNTGLLTLGGGDTNRFLPESGFIEFTRFDTNVKIFSGTFDVIFKSETGQTLHVTDGRFDLKAK